MTTTDQLTDNEVIARFMGYFNWEDSTYGNYDKDWKRLMPVWYKFRDLQFSSTMQLTSNQFYSLFMDYQKQIGQAILHAGPSPSEACKLLAEGIRWYNSTTQNKEQS